MAYLVALAMGGQAGAQVTKAMEPPSGGVSPLAWVIICALAATVVALGKVCLMLYKDLRETREKLQDVYEEPAQLLKALRVGLDMPAPPPPNGAKGGGQS